jgi:integrase
MRLNEQVIRSVALPATGYKLLRDGELPGFGLRVTANGARCFVLTYSIEGRQRRLTIGAWPAWTATTARERAKELRRQIDRGEDPLATKEQRRDAPTFKEIGTLYLERHAVNKRSGYRDREYLERDVFPSWGNRKAEDIKRRDLIELLERKAATAPIAANRLLACIRKVFNFAIERDLIVASPCYKVKAPTKENQRDRVLTEAEIATFWSKADAHLGDQINRILRLILCTAQRPGECCSVEWAEIDRESGWWSIPAAKAKNGQAHRVYLTPLAIEQLPARGESRWVFASRRGGAKPIGEGSLAPALRRERANIGVDFHAHDLRRSAASKMTGAGIARDTVKRILNHAEHDVTSIYDRYSYDPEKEVALRKWESVLRRILGDPQKAKVVQMAIDPMRTDDVQTNSARS